MQLATMDFETYSEAGYQYDPALGHFKPPQKGKPGIKGVNAATYAMHPSTDILSLAYDLKDGRGCRLWINGMAAPGDLFDYLLRGGLVEAHNSGFEYLIWEHIGRARLGWPRLRLDQLRCSMAKAKAWGLPGPLAKLSGALSPSEKKDPRGAKLIKLLSVPQKPSKAHPHIRRTRADYPELHAEMDAYNIQDVKSEEAISSIMPELPPAELALWLVDQRINIRGVAIDTEGLTNCIEIFNQAEARYTKELQAVTSGAVNSIGEMTKRSAGDKWMVSQGVNLPSLDKDGLKAALKRTDLPPAVRRAIEIRQLVGSASVKKIFAIERMVNTDGRLRNLFTYQGAERTGRFSGSGGQPQNLKNSGPDSIECLGCGAWVQGVHEACPACNCPEVREHEWGNTSTEAALRYIATRNLGTVENNWGSAVELAASCMRGLFIAAPGYRLMCSDYSAIEAVVLAALAGEQWRLDVFNTHGRIYEASASQASGVPLEEILAHKEKTGKHHPLRKKGKIRELAGGYNGWIGAWKNFGADKYMTDDEIRADVLKWRDESPAIVEMWGGQWRKDPYKWQFTPELYGVEGAVIRALQNPGTYVQYRELYFQHDTRVDVLYITLPSGRRLAYHQPRLTIGRDQRKLDVLKISFMGYNTNAQQGPVGWVRRETYGGRLVENITQAVARDILAAAMLRVEAAGYPIVLHVHDEIVAEVPQDFGSIEELESLMMIREPWFASWPIKAAGGWAGRRFRK